MLNKIKLLAIGMASMVASGAVLADAAADITAAGALGLSNAQLAVGGLITIVAVVVGITTIIGLMHKA